MNKLKHVSLSLQLCSIFSVFTILNASFIAFTLSFYHCVACHPVSVNIVQKIVKQLRTQKLHTFVMEFHETRSSILVHTNISEISHTSNVIVVFNCVYPK